MGEDHPRIIREVDVGSAFLARLRHNYSLIVEEPGLFPAPFWFAQHGRTLTCASPKCDLTARVSNVRWNLKEASGKVLA